jgi:hypothetical protein
MACNMAEQNCVGQVKELVHFEHQMVDTIAEKEF